MAYLQIKRFGMTTYVHGRTQGYRMIVEATEAEGISADIFVFLRQAIDYEETDVFQNIASPADLAEYPVGAPSDVVGSQPFFRLASVDLVFRTIELANETWAAMQEDFAQLIQTTNYQNSLDLQEVVTYGTPAPSSSSGNSSSSS